MDLRRLLLTPLRGAAMVDRAQHLLVKLSEECAEVSQRALKQLQFGRDEIQKDQPYTNGARLMEEIWHLISVVELLRAAGEINNEIYDLGLHKIELDKKRARIEKYYQYSKELGKAE